MHCGTSELRRKFACHRDTTFANILLNCGVGKYVVMSNTLLSEMSRGMRRRFSNSCTSNTSFRSIWTAPPQGEGAKVAFRTKLSLLVSSCQFGHPGEGRGREMKSKKCERSMGGLASQSPGPRRDVRTSKAYRNSTGSRAPTSGTNVPAPV